MKRLGPDEEKRLLRLCVESDQCEDFVRQYYNLVYYSVKKVYDSKKSAYTHEDIEDRLQEVFERLFDGGKKKLRQYNPEFGLRLDGWIRLISAQTVLNHFRKKKEMLDFGNYRVPVEDFDSAFGNKAEGRRLDARQTLMAVRDAVEKLNSPYKIVLKLDWFHFLGPPEISEIINKPVSEVYVIKSRGISRLKKILKESGFGF